MGAINLWRISATKNGSVIGHLSLHVDGGPYISFWPLQDQDKNQNKLFITKESMTPSYEDDVRMEGKPPDSRLRLPKGSLNVEQIKKWWSLKQTKKYNFFTNNCAIVVVKALVAGEFISAWNAWLAGIDPLTVYNFIYNFFPVKYLGSAEKNIGKIADVEKDDNDSFDEDMFTSDTDSLDENLTMTDTSEEGNNTTETCACIQNF